MRFSTIPLGIVLTLLCAGVAPAQESLGEAVSTGPSTPNELAREVVARFVRGDVEAFDALFPFERGRALARRAERHRRAPGLARVVLQEENRAILLLSVDVDFARGNDTGRETLEAADLSGVYEARPTEGAWALHSRIPLQDANAIHAHDLSVELDPGTRLGVVDTMVIDVGAPWGFAVRLNHSARVTSVELGGRSVDHAFGGGLLWLSVPQGRSRLTLRYELDLTADPDRFQPDRGHLRNQYLWHPVFELTSGTELADMSLALRAPRDTHVALDLPQVDSLSGRTRFVRGESPHPVGGLSFVYDAMWRPTLQEVDSVRLALFTTPDFRPRPDSVASAFDRVHAMLRDRFGPSPSPYFAIAQQRGRQGSGWLWSSNRLIGAASDGEPLIRIEPWPRASFAHEVAHGWIPSPTGKAADFLSESWAMFVESMVLEDVYDDPEVARAFWEFWRNMYWSRGAETPLLDLHRQDRTAAYAKGVWILRMIRDAIGEEAFERGMRLFIGRQGGEAGIEEFVAALSTAAGRDIGPVLRPWIEETVVPDLRVRVDEDDVIVSQHQAGPVFVLPVELELVTPGGTVTRTIRLDAREVAFSVQGEGTVDQVRVDPDHRLLIRRHRGEIVRFVVQTPEAEEVSLYGDFVRGGIPASRQENGVWSVTLPMTAGRYYYVWTVDGETADSGVRIVQPDRVVTAPYPK